MTKKNVFLRNVATSVACLAVMALSSSAVMAQNFQYTDASGVTCTYRPYPQGDITYAELLSIDNLPANVSKWVLPATVSSMGVNYLLGVYAASELHYSAIEGENNQTLEELVFPDDLFYISGAMSGCINLKKVTFGTNHSIGGNFQNCPLDTIVFRGTSIFEYPTDGGIRIGICDGFNDIPASVKVIIPCGTMALFVSSFNTTYGYCWYPITTANLIEAPCLNTLTVLSSDNALGNTYSFAGCGFVTQTPSNTSATHSGNITLLALPKANVVFTGWNDGNLDNPRQVNVTADITYTAQFATCTQLGIESMAANAPLRVFPNPTNNILNVELEKSTNGTLALFDMNGSIVHTVRVENFQPLQKIDISRLATGTYILRLVENGQASGGVQVIKN